MVLFFAFLLSFVGYTLAAESLCQRRAIPLLVGLVGVAASMSLLDWHFS